MIKNDRILIVDDVVDNIRIAMNILKEDHYDFSFANSGAEALELLKGDPEQFQLILLDIMMPGIDGFETCEKIKANPQTKDIPIIFLTAKTDVDSISRGFTYGAVDYITKPFYANELLARVKTHIELYQARELLKYHNILLKTKAKYEKIRLLTELEDNQKEMIYILTELMESTSDETGKHIKRVSEIAAKLAKYHKSMTDDDIETLYHAAPMHDIGKLTVPAEILHKPGRYSEEDFEIMKKHASNGYELLRYSDRKLIKAAAIIAHEHHEKWNGNGYPQGLQGDEIHIYGRIIALADVFDALTHSRRYKKAWEMEEVVNYIKERRGSQFDPELVDIFIEHLDEFIAIVNPPA